MDLDAGKYTERLESAITPAMNAAINEVASDLSGGVDGNFRSKAARRLIAIGYAEYRKERARREHARAVS